jgi:hypothetical protein
MDSVLLGELKVSRMLLGSNPFSGFSHQGIERDRAMVEHYTVGRIKDAMRTAESLGINSIVARTDHHMIRVLIEYWGEGGGLQWFAQTCPEVGSIEQCADRAARNGAKACHIHGGVMDYLVAQGKTEEAVRGVEYIRGLGMLAGIAGHNVGVFQWAEANVDVDYYMCCYYNPSRRDENPEHVHGAEELYLEEDRTAMTGLIQQLSRPAIHYKVLAAGRNDPREAFAVCRAMMRAGDMVCIGVFTADSEDMLAEDVRLFEAAAGRR